MKLTKQHLQLPAAQGIRLVALSLLDDAADAAARLASSRGSDDLHDFRVAVRRFRSWIRAFRNDVPDLKKSDLRRLKNCAAATNGGRDLEVQIEWLGTAGKGLSRGRRRGAEWLVSRLGGTGEEAGEAIGAAIDEGFEPARMALSEKLSSYSQPVRMNGASPASLAVAIGTRLVPHAQELIDALGRVQSVADEQQCHNARIMAKRLRYLLEPAAPRVKGGPAAIARLRALQESLGTLHDLQVMAHLVQGIFRESAASAAKRESEQILGAFTGAEVQMGPLPEPLGPAVPVESPARPSDLLAVAKRLRSDAEKSFKPVRDGWLDGKHTKFTDQIASVSERLMQAK